MEKLVQKVHSAKALALLAVLVFLLVPSVSLALEVSAADFESVTGVQPQGDLQGLALGGKIMGAVVDVEKVKATGFKGNVEAGGQVEIFRQSQTSVTLSFPGSGNPFPVIVNISDFK